MADWQNVLGVAGGIAGLINLGINFSKFHLDRSRISVKLIWYSEFRAVTKEDTVKYWAHIVVRNKGRRPIYITNIFIDIPNQKYAFDELSNQIDETDRQIVEGGKPLIIKLFHDRFSHLTDNELLKVRANIEDSRGKMYKSKTISLGKLSIAN